ncbi:MAG: hypothetical protein M3442_03935 [Chloroflexota bacterium]|nr:hypothetical protein [Chloroflexota bacterium]
MPDRSPNMFDDPRYRQGWVLEPPIEGIWRPLLTPGHPFNRAEDESGPGARRGMPYAWSGMTPDQLAAIFDYAPWERAQGYNDRPVHAWFLELAEAFPEVTFHGFVHTTFQPRIVVEGGEVVAPAERVLELVKWIWDRHAWKDWSRPNDVHQHKIDGTVLNGEEGANAHAPQDEGKWHHWFWWD